MIYNTARLYKVKLKKLPPILTKIIPLFIKPQCICKLIFSRLLQMAGSQNCDFFLLTKYKNVA